MVIINKKRISFIIIMLVITVFGYTITNNKTNQNTITVSNLPVSNKVIILDAGHGKPDEGAESSNRHNRSRN